jgi:hypothetical protein
MYNPVGPSFCNVFCTQCKVDKEFRLDILLVIGAGVLAVGMLLAYCYSNPSCLFDMKTPQGIFILSGFTMVILLTILKVETIFRKIWHLQGQHNPGD